MNTEQNPVGWFEIYVDDMERAKAFYEAAFETTLEPLPSSEPSLEMWSFPMDDESPGKYGAAGALCKMDGCDAGGGGTMVYFSCRDCSIEEARCEKAGGTVFKPKFSIGEHGFIAIVSDTEGNMIGLHSME